MHYEYILTYQDYLNSQKLYVRHSRGAAIKYYLWVWCLPILGLLAVIPFVVGSLQHHSGGNMAGYAGLASGGAWFAIFIPVMRWYTLRRCWKALMPSEIRNKPVTLEFTAEQVISAIPGKSEGRFFWSALQDFAQDDRITLIYIQKKLFLFVPTHAVPDAEWNDVRAKLSIVLGKAV